MDFSLRYTTSIISRMRVPTLLSVVVSLWLYPGGAMAQMAQSQTPTSALDLYGNARPAREERRRLGTYANPLQRRVLGGFQNIGRRVNRRGGLSNYAIPGDVLGVQRLFQGGRFSSGPLGRFSLAPSSMTASRHAFSRYGGFSDRASTDTGRVGDLLARRQELIAATTVNAPVHRALGQRGTFDPGLMSIAATPFVPSEAPVRSDDAPPIAELLRESVDGHTQRLLRLGWSWFSEQQYGRAYRSFESTLVVDPNNKQAGVGRVFCRLSVGAMRSAMVEVAFLARQPGNPFVQPFVLAEKYQSSDAASHVLFQTRLFAERNATQVVPEALHVYVLWYLGEKEEALRLAAVLAKRHPQSPYADWPALMQVSLAMTHGVTMD